MAGGARVTLTSCDIDQGQYWLPNGLDKAKVLGGMQYLQQLRLACQPTVKNTATKIIHICIRVRVKYAAGLTLRFPALRPGDFRRYNLFLQLNIIVIYILLHHNVLWVKVSERMLLGIHDVAESVQAKVLKEHEKRHTVTQ